MFTRTRQTFAVGFSFWQRSPQRHRAWAILASLVVMVGVYTALIGWNSQLQKSFYDALASRDAALFQHTLLMLGAVIALVLVVAVAKSYTEQALLIRWREHLTSSLMDRWLAARTYYRIERDGTLDNPTSASPSTFLRAIAGLWPFGGGLAGVVSVAHRTTLEAFHDRQLHLQPPSA